MKYLIGVKVLGDYQTLDGENSLEDSIKELIDRELGRLEGFELKVEKVMPKETPKKKATPKKK